ncbi:MAG: GNAT family N-acetyltransferase [Emergencia sp.]
MFTYRTCRPEDCTIWTQLNREFMDGEIQDAELWNDAGKTSDEIFARTFDEALGKPEMIDLILLEEDGVPVGFANLMTVFSVWTGGPAMIIDDLYIRSVYRGKGYGRMALEFIEDFARDKGCLRLQFQSELTNPDAMKFYMAVGYMPADMKFYVKYL